MLGWLWKHNWPRYCTQHTHHGLFIRNTKIQHSLLGNLQKYLKQTVDHPCHCHQYKIGASSLTLALAGQGRAFSITRPCRGGERCDPPWRFETKRRSPSQKGPIDCSRRVLAIGGIIFDPRSTFELVMAGQMSIFGEIDVFLILQDNSNGAMADIAMKPLLSCLVDNWHHFDI